MGFAIGFLYFVVLGGGIALGASFFHLRNKLWVSSKEINRLTERVSILELRYEHPTNDSPTQSPRNAAQSAPTSPVITKPIEEQVQAPISEPVIESPEKISYSNSDDINNSEEQAKETKRERKEANKKKPLLARPFLEGLQKNWIGIVGMAFFVLGFGFLGLYPSEKIAGLQKFILFAICSSTMFITTYFTVRMENWKNLSLWMRSGASAIFLFACLGSAMIPGFIWADDSLTQIILLLVGIGINLLAGYSGKTQFIAMVHVLFSLIALAIIPSTQMTIIIATLVTGFGIFLTYQKKWDVNLLVVISEFFVFHLYWNSKLPDNSTYLQLWGLGCVFVILVAALFAHYRKAYAVRKFKALPFLTHFLNWVYFAIGLAVYFEVIPQKAILFLAVGLASYFISRQGKKLNIRWLYVTDAISAYFLVFMAIITINLPQLNAFMITAILFMEAVIFLFVVSMEKESILTKIAYAFTIILGLVLIIAYFLTVIFESGNFFDLENNPLYLSSFTMLACILFPGALFYFSLIKKGSMFSLLDKKLDSIISILFSLMLTITYFKYLNQIWCLWALLVLTIPLLYLRHKWNPVGNSIGLIALLTAVSIGSWAVMGSGSVIGLTSLKETVSPVLYNLFYITPLFIGMIAGLILSGKKIINENLSKEKQEIINKNSFVLIIGTINFLIFTYILFNNISSLIPGILWLMAIPVNLEIALVLQSRIKTKRYSLIPDQIRNINHLIFSSYMVRHLLIHLQSELILGGLIRARLLLELLTIGVLIYWMIRNRSEGLRKRFMVDKISKFLLELLYFFVILTASMELSAAWLPGFWIVTAIATMILSLKIEKIPSRVRLYSLFFGWLSFFHLAFVNSAVTFSDFHGVPIKWISGGITILLQILFLILIKKIDPLQSVLFGKKNNFPKHVRKHINKWAFYPFFLALAIFIGFSFNAQIITLALIVESLLIFILSLIFKENGFRYISLASIAGCLIRLIFVDLFNSDMFIRAIVFIGVGVVMLLMNTLYLKFGKIKKDPQSKTEDPKGTK